MTITARFGGRGAGRIVLRRSSARQAILAPPTSTAVQTIADSRARLGDVELRPLRAERVRDPPDECGTKTAEPGERLDRSARNLAQCSREHSQPHRGCDRW